MPAEALRMQLPHLTAAPPRRSHVAVAEWALIGAARDGDVRAARAIYDAHVAAVFSLSSRMVGRHRAADVTQDVFIRAFERLHQFQGNSALRTWIHRITVSVALNRRRRDDRDRFVNLDEASPTAIVLFPERDPILMSRLHREIDALPDSTRTVFVLYVIEGYDHAEIAGMLGIAEGTSKSRLSNARAALRAALADLDPM